MELAGATAAMRPTVSASTKVTFCGELEGEEQRGQTCSSSRGPAGLAPRATEGLRHSPVQNHDHHGPVGTQQSRVLQARLLGLFRGDDPHALGALGDELTAQAQARSNPRKAVGPQKSSSPAKPTPLPSSQAATPATERKAGRPQPT